MKIFSRKSLTPEEKQQRSKDRRLLILSGLLFGFSFSPMPFPFTLFFFLPPLLIVLEKRDTARSIYAAYYLMLFSASAVSVYWVGAFTVMKDPFLMISGLLLFFVNPLFLSVQVPLYILVRKYVGKTAALLLVPLFWTINDYLYMFTDFSFPWTSVGHASANFNSFIQIADMIGSLGVGLLVLYINLFLYLGYKKYVHDKRPVNVYTITAVMLLVIPLLYSLYPQPKEQTTTLSVGIIQPDLDPYDKWAGSNLNDILDLYLHLSDSAVGLGAKLLVWPETALPAYAFSGAYPDVQSKIELFLQQKNVALLTGMPDLQYFTEGNAPPKSKYSKEGGYYYRTHNAAFLLQPGHPMQRFSKRKLVPFGEKIPYADELPWLGALFKWGVGLSGWNEGIEEELLTLYRYDKAGKGDVTDSVKILPLICYESVYPLHTKKYASKGAQLLVVVTNDSWYGNTSGPYQHRDFAKLRAVENRLPVIRAANGGISCIIDERGIIHTSLPMYTKGIIVESMALPLSK